MTDLLSLGPVLDLIERVIRGDDSDEALRELWRVLPFVRQHAEQHAAQLREQVPEFREHHFNVVADTMEAAADFLCAPRREPEAE